MLQPSDLQLLASLTDGCSCQTFRIEQGQRLGQQQVACPATLARQPDRDPPVSLIGIGNRDRCQRGTGALQRLPVIAKRRVGKAFVYHAKH